MVTRTQKYSGNEQHFAILCADSPGPPPGAYLRLQRLLLRRGGAVGLLDVWGEEPCATWPVHQLDAYHGPWNAPTNPILVINNTNDSATPLQNAIAMTHDLADARLLVGQRLRSHRVPEPEHMRRQLHDHLLPQRRTAAQGNRMPPEPHAVRVRCADGGMTVPADAESNRVRTEKPHQLGETPSYWRHMNRVT
jgi:hypothetical protein